MPNRKLHIAIIGCGTAGPATAALLAEQGHHISLFDKAPECKPVGAGFMLQPSGWKTLKRLNILDEIIAHGSKIDSLHVLEHQQGTLLNLKYAEVSPSLFGIGLHRPVLLRSLLSSMQQRGVEVTWHTEIVSTAYTHGKWILTAHDGNTHGPFDLLVLSDGARSNLRSSLPVSSSDRGYEWGAHWLIGENDGSFRDDELWQIAQSTKVLCGFLPTGTNEIGGSKLVSFFWSIKIADDLVIRQSSLQTWKNEVLNVAPHAENFLTQITSWNQFATVRYGDVQMKEWHGEAVVVLGDAAHAMSPQLGQGVNLALTDALCLAECLQKHSLQEALSTYSKKRKHILRYYQFTTRWLTPLYQSDHEWLTPIRRSFFCFSNKIKPVRKIMTITMAGTKE